VTVTVTLTAPLNGTLDLESSPEGISCPNSTLTATGGTVVTVQCTVDATATAQEYTVTARVTAAMGGFQDAKTATVSVSN
jgi:hypothetical protein